MPPREKSVRQRRPPRIRVPNQERAIFTVDDRKFIGVIQRLSETGGSALLAKGPIAKGTLGEMDLRTVFGKVNAQIEFLQTGADGVPLAQAFRFLGMDEISKKRFHAAAKQMESAGFADDSKAEPVGVMESWGKLRESIRQLSEVVTSGRKSRSKV